MCIYTFRSIGRIVVRSRIAGVVAATLLSVGAGRVMAGETQFQAPDTERARQAHTVLAQAAEALSTEVPRAAGEHISSLWVFPTAAEDTVFVQYVVNKGQGSLQGAGSRRHLELMKVSDNRIVELIDLTRAGNDGASRAGLDRTAFIGTGHAATNVQNAGASLGSPASPHWSASIGTGHVSGESVQGSQAVVSEAVVHGLALQAPVLHWTSKIGTGHAEDSSKSPPNGGVRVTAVE